MAAEKRALILLLAFLFPISLTIRSSDAVECVGAGGIAVYWGQHTEEGSLREACATGNYQFVILEELLFSDDGTTKLNLAGHCGGSSSCTDLEPDIQYCQSQGIKVFLNIQPGATSEARRGSTVSDSEAATKLAEYLLQNFLSNKSGPLGSVALDGIDIADVGAGGNLKWDEVVKAINASTTDRRIYISAAPQCVYPDYYLNDAINTGLVDYIWVEFFYSNPCIYKDGDPSALLAAWNDWTTKVPTNSLIFLGLPASSGKEDGYIPPEVLKSEILPTIKKSSNYGGVMLWDRYEDQLNDPSYSDQIKDSVPKGCRCVCDDDSASSNFYGLPGRSLPF